MKTVSFDVDGTLTSSPFDSDRIAELPVRPDTVKTLRTLHDLGYSIRIVTARPEQYRSTTAEWLKRNGIPYNELRMRSSSDNRPDHELRAEQSDGSIVLFDDKPANCEHSRAKCVRV